MRLHLLLAVSLALAAVVSHPVAIAQTPTPQDLLGSLPRPAVATLPGDPIVKTGLRICIDACPGSKRAPRVAFSIVIRDSAERTLAVIPPGDTEPNRKLIIPLEAPMIEHIDVEHDSSAVQPIGQARVIITLTPAGTIAWKRALRTRRTDIPADVFAAGNPCRVISRALDNANVGRPCRGGRDHSKLLHVLHDVPLLPELGDLPIRDSKEIDAGHIGRLAGGRNAKHLTLLSAAGLPPDHDEITLGDDLCKEPT